MLLIIEWPDLSWKTTLIKKLKSIFGTSISFKLPNEILPKNWSEIERMKIYNWYLTSVEFFKRYNEQFKNNYIIQDRFYISELVYWKIFRWYEPFENINLQKIEEKIKEIPHLVIYLSDDLEWYQKRFEQYGDDKIKKFDTFKKLLNRYNEVFEKINLNKIMINPFKDENHLNKIINKIIEIKNIKKINNNERSRIS